MEAQKTILVVDDENKITEVLKAYLEKAGYRVATAESGHGALNAFKESKPSCVVLDLMLPDLPGEEVCREIRKTSGVPIIMLTAKVEEQSILNGLGMGADDYVTKPFSPRQVVARVQAVLRRAQGETSPESKEYSSGDGRLIIRPENREVIKQGKDVSLTPNEFKILLSLAKYPNKVFTREELITVALGDEYEGFDRVIDTHIKNIRQKIEDNAKSPRYVVTVHGVGYRFGGGVK